MYISYVLDNTAATLLLNLLALSNSSNCCRLVHKQTYNIVDTCCTYVYIIPIRLVTISLLTFTVGLKKYVPF